MLKEQLIKRIASIEKDMEKNVDAIQKNTDEVHHLNNERNQLIGALSECNYLLNYVCENE